ncbi:MAG: phosphatidylglycerophosphatase A, partial [Bacteroidota bacterium]
DPSKVVIDEMAGMWISLLWLPFSPLLLLLAFLLFRAFDIGKPFYIRQMEKLPSGWGIMMDDVLAGVYTNLLLQIGLFFI